MENSNDHDDQAERSSDERNEDVDNSNSDEETLSDESDNRPELNDQRLLQLKRNDPKATSLYAHWEEDGYVNSVDWEEKGNYIGDNTHLQKVIIQISDRSYRPNGYQISGLIKDNFVAFCKGLARNRSIRRLRIIGCTCMAVSMETLYSFLEHNSNLSHLVMDSCNMDTETTRLLVSALSNRRNKSSLRRLELVSCGIRGPESEELIASLNQYCNLVQLCLGGNQIGLNGCVELGKLLQKSRLKELDIECNDIDDECIDVLIGPLTKNESLIKLSLSQNKDITTAGWQIFSALLRDPNSVLEALHLSETGLDDEGAAVIANALVNNSTLKILYLYYNENISTNGWQAFFHMLQNSVSALEEVNLIENNIDDESAVAMTSAFANLSSLKILQLDENKSIETIGWQAISNLLQSRITSLVELNLSVNKIEDEASVALANALTDSPSLKILNLNSNRFIGAIGWRAFSNCFQSLALEELDLSMNRIEDEAAGDLANSLSNMPTLKNLKLTGIEYITATGWIMFSAVLSNLNSALQKLDLSINTIGDEAAVAFANALTNNSSLKIIDFDANQSISDVGWQAFSRLVCKSSIIDTFHSNHTLHQLCDGNSSEHLSDLPSDLIYSLRLNRNNNKNEVVRQKILWSHFQDDNVDINIKEFFHMELKAMPFAITWIGRDDVGHPLLYQLVRSMPSLVERGNEHDNKRKAVSSKTKLGRNMHGDCDAMM